MKREKRKTLNIVSVIGIVLIIGTITAIYYITPEEPAVEYKEEWLKGLPEVPQDLLLYKRDIISGTLSDVCEISSEYWKNPEFYPNWEKAKNEHYIHHDYSRWGAYGYGSYPADAGIEVTNIGEGEFIELCTLFKSSFNIETYQGVKLVPITHEYFDMEVTPNLFLLEPTFPTFSEGWVRLIEIKVKAKQDVPAGTYTLGFHVTQPTNEENGEFVWETLRKDVPEDIEYIEKCIEALKRNEYFSDQCESLYINRRKKYVAGGSWGIGRPFYTVTIKVG